MNLPTIYVYILMVGLWCLLHSCAPSSPTPPRSKTNAQPDTSSLPSKSQSSIPVPVSPTAFPSPQQTYMDTTQWINIATLEPSIHLDIRYATTNNFVGQKLYPCPACYLRPQTAYAIQKIHRKLQQNGLGIKVYDCYRPQYIQQKLWDIKPDPRFVTDPTKGSIHSRGNAVDLTLIDSTGHELDMGTPFDYFGVQAYHAYTKHPEIVNANRKKLLDAMTEGGFKAITTEWWHYSYRKGVGSLSDERWVCPH